MGAGYPRDWRNVPELMLSCNAASNNIPSSSSVSDIGSNMAPAASTAKLRMEICSIKCKHLQIRGLDFSADRP
ncbi:uncharacterized protein PHALS_04381 [Plasmopara halstedii]|uniref:Uncharacterized protein n=1 Tax=Plasmopara halstedii TaxID=4781 RepID=A0A0P1B0S2_PLAHL|nr:uncharacterized protein PHALS_04381 [Plasmopara halstedii]CEG47513.1 hypothetical protein PHALS_04381 [Plasmopara halstedii]|eukprot:XP_024583882.1 hypothetical protein PHALS_04381 [Plasmopara halstedii]